MRVPSQLIQPTAASASSAGLLGRIQAGTPPHLALGQLSCVDRYTSPRPRRHHHPKAARSPWRSSFNKLMVTVMVLASVGTLASGTLATFTAQTGNAGNTFTTGTLAVNDGQVVAGSVTQSCLSYGTLGGTDGKTVTNGNVNSGCFAVNMTSAQLAEPGTVAVANFQLSNPGALNGSVLKVYPTSCTTTADTTQSFHGPTTNDLCAALNVYAQEYTSIAFTTAKTACVYPASTTAACSFASGPQTINQMITAGGGSISGGLTGTSCSSACTPTRWVQIAVQVPTTLANGYQGLIATFTLDWELDQ
jgi:hypothetical protein